MRKRPILALLVASSMAATLVACSDDSGDNSSSPTTPPAQSQPDTSTHTPTPTPSETEPDVREEASREIQMAYSEWAWSPGSVIYLDRILGDGSGRCTTSFSFGDFSGNYDRYYAITSGHCGYLGDVVYAEPPSYGYPPVGKVVYSAWADNEGGSQHSPYDWAVIEITDPDEPLDQMVEPSDIRNAMALSPIPSGNIVGAGSTTGINEGWIDSNQVETTANMTGPDGNVSRGLIADVCSRPGDSGGPKMIETDQGWITFGVTSWVDSDKTIDVPCGSGETSGITPTWAFMDTVMSMYPNSSIQTTTATVY